MKNLVLFSILFLFAMTSVFAQSLTCDCKTDLAFIVEKIKKMPSYKKQIKGQKETQFETVYASLSKKLEQPILIEDCYKMLLEQMSLINDVHASLRFNDTYLTTENAKDDAKLSAFKTSDLFKNHPKTLRDLSELKKELSKKAIGDLEGIYGYGDQQQIGIYYADNKMDFIGVVLESQINQWEAGEIKFYLTHTNGIKYDVYYYNHETRTPSFIKSMSFENGRIWSYKKVGNTSNAELPIQDQSDWVFKTLNTNTQYLYFGNFSSFSKENKETYKTFYANVKTKLSAENIIVDLRSNRGGNSKLSDPFLKLLKNKNVYILTNCFAGSNGEQFVLKLKDLKNAQHLGQTTRGIIAYGMNYGYQHDTPSGHFMITPTDMNFHKYIQYEGKGVSPERPLDFDRDWIEQTLEIIEKDAQ
ncbi:S41 family peptidase [Psychroserpens burtonensis]|uniref:S41 family peptidase n=1 Tax=Psychroserpens burtonensis TaxID=49278 RepID=UPI00041A23F6|nr:S41 family peptidase [Psychroserpens burtonensis]